MSTLDTHPDFDQLVVITAGEIGILPALALKDYWVTRILRSIASDPVLRRQVIFKGGTSLSKGWRLIDRFSEDIDLLTTGPEFSDPPGTAAREKILKAVRKRIENDTPLRLPELEELPPEQKNFHYSRGSYHCNIRYALPGLAITPSSAFTDFVLVEMGFRGGTHPHLPVSLNSFVGEMILGLGGSQRKELAEYEADFAPFELELLHPARTFVEKLLALHCAISRDIKLVRTRHYYDIVSLFEKSQEVRASLKEEEFSNLARNAVAITIQFFEPDLDPNLNLAATPALNLTQEQIELLANQYRNESEYYFQGQPPFEELMGTVLEIRDILRETFA